MSLINTNSIFVIESLGNERQTGQELYHDIIKPFEYKLNGFKTEHHKVYKKGELNSVLQRIIYLSKNKNYRPIIHFDCHGDRDKRGLILAKSKELIEWSYLEKFFRKINILLKNSLFITLGVCHGSNLQIIAIPPKEVPFFGLISPLNSISMGEIIEGYTDFYQNLLFETDLIKSIKSIKKNSKFKLYGTEFFFERFVEHWKEELKEERLKSETERIIEIVLKNQGWNRSNVKYEEFYEKCYAERKADLISELKKHRDKYLMIDRFPEIENRFEDFEILLNK